MPQPAPAVHRAQKQRVDAFQHQRAEHHCQRHNRAAGHRAHQLQRQQIHRQHRAEQQMQQFHAVAAQADQNHANRQAAQIKRGEIRIFLQFRETADQPGKKRHQHARHKAAQPHRRQAQSRHHIAHRRARQHRVAQSIANQAHAAHHQKHAHRCGRQCQKHHRCQRVTHKGKFGKGFDE